MCRFSEVAVLEAAAAVSDVVQKMMVVEVVVVVLLVADSLTAVVFQWEVEIVRQVVGLEVVLVFAEAAVYIAVVVGLIVLTVRVVALELVEGFVDDCCY